MVVPMQISTNEAKEIVLGFVKALNDESFQVARRYLDDDLKHVGPLAPAMEEKHIFRRWKAFV
jgi:hypothetical protein